jgi:hypothetical protein
MSVNLSYVFERERHRARLPDAIARGQRLRRGRTSTAQCGSSVRYRFGRWSMSYSRLRSSR